MLVLWAVEAMRLGRPGIRLGRISRALRNLLMAKALHIELQKVLNRAVKRQLSPARKPPFAMRAAPFCCGDKFYRAAMSFSYK